MTKEQIEAIVATLPEHVRDYTKLDEQGKTILRLVKNDAGEWSDVTSDTLLAEKLEKLRKELVALQLLMAKLETDIAKDE